MDGTGVNETRDAVKKSMSKEISRTERLVSTNLFSCHRHLIDVSLVLVNFY
jgi:hypothetical protein